MTNSANRSGKPIAGGATNAALGPSTGNVRPGRILKVLLLVGLIAGLATVMALATNHLGLGERSTAATLPPMTVTTPVGAPHFVTSINGVSRPLGVAVSASGDRIYVTESDGGREIKVFDKDGHPVGDLTPPDSDPSSRIPVYVAVAPDGSVFVSDRGSNSVHIFSADGKYLHELEPPSDLKDSWKPLAVAFDHAGNLLVTNLAADKHSVIVLSPDGKILLQKDGTGAAGDKLSYPNGVAADQTGRVLVSDSNNERVVVVDPSGLPSWSFGQALGINLGLPRGIAVDSRNRAYVADTVGHNLLVFELGEQNAKLLFTVGGQGIGNGQFNFPNGLAIDGSDRLYVTDRENNRVQVWSY